GRHRFGHGDFPRGLAPDLGTVFHDQGCRPGDGPRPPHRAEHRGKSPRFHFRRDRTRKNRFSRSAAARAVKFRRAKKKPAARPRPAGINKLNLDYGAYVIVRTPATPEIVMV